MEFEDQIPIIVLHKKCLIRLNGEQSLDFYESFESANRASLIVMERKRVGPTAKDRPRIPEHVCVSLH
ncbi:hypothetical protein BpHYR1_035633 [Brachionus plicatilis]|uniref:Uncharacterized protein n=1 Tax=Brachionus plicatilis TaxID=10195 RepID=A0A3M7RPX6_BRAPC|nr:hypothetical protein BpHYR1_035633 [Brachionus plicatilis]